MRLALLFALVACRSDGASYYTLVSPASSEPAAAPELQLEILPVDVPADVDRAEIVVRTSAGEVTPVQTRAWIAPLSLEVRHAFSDDLTRVLRARDVSAITAAPNVPTFRIKLSIQRFDSLIGKRAIIEAVSTVREGAGPALICSHRSIQEAGPGYAALAEAHQRALIAIANGVAASVRALRAGASMCP